MNSAHWNRPNTPPALAADAVHVWRFNLALERQGLEELWEALSQEEQARAERFRFETDRKRFIAAHGVLRHILAGYLNRRPADLIFGAGDFGKPFVVSGSPEESSLRFNLSHSGELALCAVSPSLEVGV